MIQEVGYRGGEVEVFGSDLIENAMGFPDGYIRHDVCHHQGMVAKGDFNEKIWVEECESGLDYLIHYPKTRSYGVQGHPEWGHKETEDLFFAGIDLVMNYQEGN